MSDSETPIVLPNTDARDAIERSLCARLALRTEDELRVVDFVLSRIEKGADQYGPLELAKDPRDWAKEEAEELADAMVYRAAARRIAQVARASGDEW